MSGQAHPAFGDNFLQLPRAASLRDLFVCNAVSEGNARYSPEAPLMESVELLGDSLHALPCLASVNGGWNDDRGVRADLHRRADRWRRPDVAQALEHVRRLADPASRVPFRVPVVGYNTAEVGEIIDIFNDLLPDG